MAGPRKLCMAVASVTLLAPWASPGARAQEGAPQHEVTFALGQRYTITSKVLGSDRDLVVRTPSGYDDMERTYPVFYLLGSDFRERLALTAATLEYMAGQGQIPRLILVGVELPEGNFGLIPRDEKNGGTESSDRYARFLEREVFPFVERTVRTNGYRILYGGSNSGAGVLYWLFAGKVTVQAAIASSPMLGWSPDLLFDVTRSALHEPKHGRRTLFLIASDDDFGRVTDHFARYVALIQREAPDWLRWKAETRVNEWHVPETDTAAALRMIFEGTNPAETLADAAAFREHYDAVSRRCGMTVAPPAPLLFDTGIDLVSRGELQKGHEIFELHVAQYPEDARAHAGLGFALKALGDTKAARRSLERALELDPKQPFAQRLLGEIDR